MMAAFLTNNVVTNVVLVSSIESAQQLWPSATFALIAYPAGIDWVYDPNTNTYSAPTVEPDPAPPTP